MTDYNSMNDEEFRHMVRDFIEKNYPDEKRFSPRRLHWDEIRDWVLALSKQGWVAPNWPTEHGGMGLAPGKFLIFIEEQERWGVARAPDMGVTMVGPLIIQYGTDEQRKTYLPKIISGAHVWCQGYSEPNAGSDLADLRTEAVPDGEDFIVNGQKTWTTLAQDANHMYMLVRTDKTGKKQEGISFLLVDFKTPGITVRPIRNIAGHEEFCEVFFDNVRVPRKNIVGEMNEGWFIAKVLLGFERLFLGSPKQALYALHRLDELGRHLGLFADQGFVDKFTKLQLDVLDLESIYARYADRIRRGEKLGPDVSILKIWATETFARLSEMIVESAGSAGAISGTHEIDGRGFDVLSPFYDARPATIYGGSNEIQRNIVAKVVLNLPSK